MGAEVFHALKKVPQGPGLNTAVGDEGGFAPEPGLQRGGPQMIMEAIEEAGYTPGKQVCIALDPAASEFYAGRASTVLQVGDEPSKLTPSRHGGLLRRPGRAVPHHPHRGRPGRERLGRLEAADRASWATKIQIVGDDLFVTNTERLRRGHRDGYRQLDPHQGQPDRDADRDAGRHRDGQAGRLHGRGQSHRSGETEDTTIADIVVATNAGQIKTGAPAAPTASPSTTSSCASRRSSATATPGPPASTSADGSARGSARSPRPSKGAGRCAPTRRSVGRRAPRCKQRLAAGAGG